MQTKFYYLTFVQPVAYEDIEAINYAVCSGVKGIFTAHGATIEDIKLNPNINNLIENRYFERIIFLSDRIEK